MGLESFIIMKELKLIHLMLEKREMVASSASAAVPSASPTPSSASVTQLSASAAASARVVSSLVETRRAGCAVRSVRRTDG
jgi:hypothetical protein